MLSFLERHPPKTRVAHLSRLVFDDGRSSVEFHAPTDPYLVRNSLPPSPSHYNATIDPHPANCALNPPVHWHSKQTETFHVLQGEARIYLEGKQITASAGQVVHIPLAAHHTFRNASSENELLIEFKLDPATRQRDESFFRNVWTYRDDCRKNGMTPNFFQVCMFNRQGNVALALPGPRLIARPLALIINFLGSMIGRFVIGFSYSYEDYYHPKS